MSIGSSGRIVIEVDPRVKRHLYAALTKDGMSLKEWFLTSAQAYLSSVDQMNFSPTAEKLTEAELSIINMRLDESGKT